MKKEIADIREQQSHYVVKANALIQKTRLSMTAQQQKLLNFMISKIKPEDTPETEYKIRIIDFCKVCGIIAADETSAEIDGKTYQSVKDDLKKIQGKSTWIQTDDDTEELIFWFGELKIRKKNGNIIYSFSKGVYPYLFSLKEQFTQYRGYFTYMLSGQYSIRLYELLKSYQWQGHEKTIDLDELKRRLNAETYTEYFDLKRRVIEPAIEEINRGTDMKIEYKPMKNGRAVAAIKFLYLSLSRQDVEERQEHMFDVLKLDE